MAKARLSKVVQVRLTAQQEKLIKAYAVRFGLTVSEYLRCAALAYGDGWEKEAALEKWAMRAFHRVAQGMKRPPVAQRELKKTA